MPDCLRVAAGPSKVWDLNDVCKRITLDAFMGWGFDSSLNVSDGSLSPAYNHPT